MKQFLIIGVVAAALAGCGDYNPLNNPRPEGDLDLLPGTEDASPDSPIQRYEEDDGTGNGYAQGISYNAANDTFTVDNLAFDGNNRYSRDDVMPNLGAFNVYENASTYNDDITGVPINQFPHKAIYGESASGDTRFAIVRTGAYYSYGFGGFMYQRDDGVVLPTTGQAAFTGDYAGLRDFNGNGGLEYVTGDMTMAIDFKDFNDGYGVQGHVTNRQIFSVDGNNLTAAYETAYGVTDLPSINFTVGPGVMDVNGELTGGVTSFIGAEAHETGSYYALLTGEGADMEVVGVIVVESEHPINDDITIRETGGFILYR